MMPVSAPTFRMRPFQSPMYKLPAPSSATLVGEFRSALVADPPSPPNPPCEPLPTSVVIEYCWPNSGAHASTRTNNSVRRISPDPRLLTLGMVDPLFETRHIWMS